MFLFIMASYLSFINWSFFFLWMPSLLIKTAHRLVWGVGSESNWIFLQLRNWSLILTKGSYTQILFGPFLLGYVWIIFDYVLYLDDSKPLWFSVLLFCGFLYLHSTVFWWCQIENSKNKQLVNFKLCIILSSKMKFCTILLHLTQLRILRTNAH